VVGTIANIVDSSTGFNAGSFTITCTAGTSSVSESVPFSSPATSYEFALDIGKLESGSSYTVNVGSETETYSMTSGQSSPSITISSATNVSAAGIAKIISYEGVCTPQDCQAPSGDCAVDPIATNLNCEYNDSAGKCTIGYGTLLSNGPCLGVEDSVYSAACGINSIPDGINDTQARCLLQHEIYAKDVPKVAAIKAPLTQDQFDALVDLAYNAGPGAVSGQLIKGDPALDFPGLNNCSPSDMQYCYNGAALWLLTHYIYTNCATGCKVNQNLADRRDAEADSFWIGQFQTFNSVTEQVGDPISINVYTSSNVSDFTISGSQQITFTVSGTPGTQGTTEVPVSGILSPPYAITLDGKAINFDNTTDTSGNGTILIMTYQHSTHTIVISGSVNTSNTTTSSLGKGGGAIIGFAIVFVVIAVALGVFYSRRRSRSRKRESLLVPPIVAGRGPVTTYAIADNAIVKSAKGAVKKPLSRKGMIYLTRRNLYMTHEKGLFRKKQVTDFDLRLDQMSNVRVKGFLAKDLLLDTMTGAGQIVSYDLKVPSPKTWSEEIAILKSAPAVASVAPSAPKPPLQPLPESFSEQPPSAGNQPAQQTSGPMKYCFNCGRQIYAKASFCPNCGEHQ
jgi:GH24 family phage-related lysozyme (muramidase)